MLCLGLNAATKTTKFSYFRNSINVVTYDSDKFWVSKKNQTPDFRIPCKALYTNEEIRRFSSMLSRTFYSCTKSRHFHGGLTFPLNSCRVFCRRSYVQSCTLVVRMFHISIFWITKLLWRLPRARAIQIKYFMSQQSQHCLSERHLFPFNFLGTSLRQSNIVVKRHSPIVTMW